MKRLFYILFLIPILLSCGSKGRFEIDTAINRKVVKVERFDLRVIQMDTLKPLDWYADLKENYRHFLPLYLSHLTDSVISDEEAAKLLKDFATSTLVAETNAKVVETFSDISGIESELSDAFTYLAHYFPNIDLPKISFFVSGLNFPMMANRDFSVLGVGVDFYLGEDYEPYKAVVYDYMQHNMQPNRISVDVVSAVLLKNFPYDGKQNRLLDNILYQGKIIYLLSVFMPNRSVASIIGYTDEQMAWAENNEERIWETIVGNKDLYSSDLHLIGKYINEAPFTAPVSQESPSKLGVWIGFKIVDSYMNKNADTTLQKLMQMNDYQQLLQDSGF